MSRLAGFSLERGDTTIGYTAIKRAWRGEGLQTSICRRDRNRKPLVNWRWEMMIVKIYVVLGPPYSETRNSKILQFRAHFQRAASQKILLNKGSNPTRVICLWFFFRARESIDWRVLTWIGLWVKQRCVSGIARLGLHILVIERPALAGLSLAQCCRSGRGFPPHGSVFFPLLLFLNGLIVCLAFTGYLHVLLC